MKRKNVLLRGRNLDRNLTQGQWPYASTGRVDTYKPSVIGALSESLYLINWPLSVAQETQNKFLISYYYFLFCFFALNK